MNLESICEINISLTTKEPEKPFEPRQINHSEKGNKDLEHFIGYMEIPTRQLTPFF
jgi:hypothetical protein